MESLNVFLLSVASNIGGFTTGLVTSDIGYGQQVFQWLQQPNPLLSGTYLFNGLIALLIVLLTIGWMIDICNLKCACVRWTYVFILVIVGLADLILLAPKIPSLLHLFGVSLTLLTMYLINATCFCHMQRERHLRTSSCALLTTAILSVLLWAYFEMQKLSIALDIPGRKPLLPPHVRDKKPTDPELVDPDAEQSNDKVMSFLAISPLLLACEFVFASFISWMRAHAYMIDRDNDQDNPFGPELQLSLGILVTVAFVSWAAIALMHEEEQFSIIVMEVSLFFFIAVAFYIATRVGLRRLQDLQQQNVTLQMATNLIFSDWTKAAVGLVFMPFLPIYLGLQHVRHAAMACLRDSGLLERRPGIKPCGAVKQWDMASILVKMMYAGLALVFLQFCLKLLPVLLVWLKATLKEVDLLVCLLVLFAAEIVLFLFPPVSGQPLYILVTVVLVPKLGYDTPYKFWIGIGASIAFCMVVKMSAIALEQKMIGVPFSNNVAVKQFIGVHTPFMKALRYILSEKELSRAKVAVLTGGPDWPTSVLTGILNLPLFSMLYGSLPVIFLIAPCCLSGGFLLRAADEQDEETKRVYKAVQQISGALALVMPAGINVLLVHCVQAVTTKFQHELNTPNSKWQQDPQETEVLALVRDSEARAANYRERTHWDKQPRWVKVLSVLGAVLSSAATFLLLFGKPITPFSLEQKLEDIPGGSVAGLINPAGWAALIVVGLVFLILTVVLAWMRRASQGLATDGEDGEDSSHESSSTHEVDSESESKCNGEEEAGIVQ